MTSGSFGAYALLLGTRRMKWGVYVAALIEIELLTCTIVDRTMTRIPGMKTLIVTLGRSMQALSNVLFLLAFLIGIAGILSIDLLSGSLRGRCFVVPNMNITDAVRSRLESQQVSLEIIAFPPTCSSAKLNGCYI